MIWDTYMKKTLYIHIGAHKTGTSAIQTFLSTNRDELARKGYLYPGTKMGHNEISEELRIANCYEMSNPYIKTQKYFDEITQSKMNVIILSSEGLERLTSLNILKEFLKNQFDVKVVFYVRRQDDRLESMYNQRIRQQKVFLDRPFSEFISSSSFKFLDYYQKITLWSDAFGKENIIIRCYEKEQMPEGIIHDFLSIIGIKPDESFQYLDNIINQSMNWDLIEIIRLCNVSIKNDPHFKTFLKNRLKEINQEYQKEQRRLFSPQQRRDIIFQYEESNARVAREYLGREDGILFFAPLPDPDEPWEPYSSLTVEKFVPIFTQLLYNMEHKLNKKSRLQRKRSLQQRIFFRINRLRSPVE